MKKIRWLGRLVWGVLLGCTSPALAGSADADWVALQTAGLVPFTLGADTVGVSARERLDRDERRRQRLRELGAAFCESHPTDPRRWSVVWWMWNRPPLFIAGGPNFDRDRNDVLRDEAGAMAWKARLGEWVAAQAVATDVPAAVRELFEGRLISESIVRAIGPVFAQPDADLPLIDWTPLLSRLTAFDAHYPRSGKTLELVEQFMNYYPRAHSARESARVWQRFATGPNEVLVAKVRERLRLYELVVHPLELQFMAADGRAVDLGRLRGKVVLIDFWATWCHPCIEEIPNVLANYQRYHAQGFEVIGITLENAHLAPTDTPEQSAAKLAKARKALLDFAKAHALPWPQYFDGKGWKNDLFTAYAVQELPAALLLDQEGRLVSAHARGTVLEREVRKLLKL